MISLRKPLAVCLKAVHFPFDSNAAIRLLEWIEVNRAIGADVYIYGNKLL